MTATEALIKILEIYSQTDNFISQEFYQSLCTKASENLKILVVRIKNLEAVIAAQKQTIRNQGAGCEARHNILCEIKEITDHYFMKG